MSIKLQKTDENKILIGDALNEQQKKALASVSISANDILNNMDDLNADLETVNVDDGEAEEILTKLQNSHRSQQTVRKLPEVNIPKPPMGLRRESFEPSDGDIKRFDPHNRVVKQKGNKMNLDQELESMSNEVQNSEPAEDSADQPKEAAPGEGPMKGQIMELLRNTPGAPDQAQIEGWKAQHGNNAVHVMALGEGDVYIFTHLKRGQWKKIQEITAKAQEVGDKNIEDSLKEKVIQYAVLWPNPLPIEFLYNSRAGVVDSLYEVILLNSYFLSPQQAIMLTTQL